MYGCDCRSFWGRRKTRKENVVLFWGWLSMEPKYIDRYLPLQTYIQTEVLFIRFSIFFRIRLFSLRSGFLYLQKAEKSWPIIFFLGQEIQRQLFFNDVSKYYGANSIEASINLHIRLFWSSISVDVGVCSSCMNNHKDCIYKYETLLRRVMEVRESTN